MFLTTRVRFPECVPFAFCVREGYDLCNHSVPCVFRPGKENCYCLLWSLLLDEITQAKSLLLVVTLSYPPLYLTSSWLLGFVVGIFFLMGISVFGFQGRLRCCLPCYLFVWHILLPCDFSFFLCPREFFYLPSSSQYYQREIFQPPTWTSSISGAE